MEEKVSNLVLSSDKEKGLTLEEVRQRHKDIRDGKIEMCIENNVPLEDRIRHTIWFMKHYRQAQQQVQPQ